MVVYHNAAQSGMLVGFAVVEAALTSNRHLYHFRNASLLVMPSLGYGYTPLPSYFQMLRVQRP